MRVLAIVASLDDPSARFRVGQFVAPLSERGITVETEAVPGGFRARRALFARARGFDAVLWQRRLLPPLDAAALRSAARRLVFDFDDALPFRDSFRGASASLARRVKFRAALRRSDVVLAANETLAKLARPHAREVVVVPTVVDAHGTEGARAWGGGTTRHASEAFVAGWVGSAATLPYLDAIRHPLEEVARTLGSGRFRLAVVADRRPEWGEGFLDFRPFAIERERRDVAGFDAGLGPLSDDAWARGKSGLKLLLYGAEAVPAVASPVGVQSEIVRDGVTGFHARSGEEWVDRIARLARDPALARRMGLAAREAVVARYSVAAAIDLLRRALTGIPA